MGGRRYFIEIRAVWVRTGFEVSIEARRCSEVALVCNHTASAIACLYIKQSLFLTEAGEDLRW
jgi:hypothetical protein